MHRTGVVCVLLLSANFLSAAPMPSNQQAAAPDTAATEKVPVIDGAAGSCSLDLTITSDDKPVYAAKVNVHIAYGFGGLHKLDLEASTNINGKVKFTGIPAKVRRQILEFNAAKDQLTSTFTYDPAKECQATHVMALKK